MINEFFIKIALAQDPLVPSCPGGDVTQCGEAELLQLGVNIINFMIQWLAFPLVIIFFLWGGFLLLTSSGSPTRIEQGKKAITGAVVGLVIVLTSVVVINTVLQFLIDPEVCNFDPEKKTISVSKLECPGLIQGGK